MSINIRNQPNLLTNVHRICQKFVHTPKQIPLNYSNWIKPQGKETGIVIYNPITKSKVPLIQKNEHFLSWYLCGPTVYDFSHIGHAVTYVKSDIIHRILVNYFNIHTVKIMGITDIDDKIIKLSNESGKTCEEITKFYENEFFNDMKNLNVLPPYSYFRVTNYIPEIILFISNILNENYAYVATDGSVLFDTMKYKNYGKLFPPFPDDGCSGKKSALDFALWKSAKENEPFWESPWGKGRPGWHIECSAIASTVFGNSIDLHSGGIDLIFPHHENEEAQSCCYHKIDQWVNYWLHFGHLNLKDDVKMSKSLKNTIKIKDHLLNYSANEFRMLCLLSKYRNGIEYSNQIMEHAASVLNKIENFISDCNNYIAGKAYKGTIDEPLLLASLYTTKNQIHLALADDFDTTQAILEIVKLVQIGNKMFHENPINTNISGRNLASIAAVSNFISTTIQNLGILDSTTIEENHNVKDIIDHFVAFRHKVRTRSKEMVPIDKTLFNACDEARNNLNTCGIEIKDQPGTSTWRIKSTQINHNK